MRTNGLLPILLVFVMLLAVYIGHSQGYVSEAPKSMIPGTPIEGGIFLLLSAVIIYGGKVLYRKD